MSYFDIVKRGVNVANRNILAIGIQLIFFIVMFALLVLLILAIIGMFVGSFAALGNAAQSPEKLLDVIGSSFSAIFMGVLVGLFFLIIAGIMNAYVQAGIMGCLIASARDDSKKFDISSFFSSAWASGIHFFWLQLMIFIVGLGGFVTLGSTGAIVVAVVLMPLKASGSTVAAFAIGVPFITLLILAALVYAFLLFGAARISQVSLVDGRRGAFSAIGDTWDFFKGRFWDIILFTLMIIFLLFCANLLIEFMTLPMNILSQKNPLAVLWFLPVLFLAMLLRMYITIAGQACYAVYYLAETAPPPSVFVTPPEPPQEFIPADFVPEDEPTQPGHISGPEEGPGSGQPGI